MKLLKSFYFHVYTPLASLFFPSIYWKIKTKKPCLYLTFDDGPNPVSTPFILAILEKYATKASFFVIGENAVQNKNELLAIKKQGHLIGNHTFTHVHGWRVSTQKYCAEVEQTDAVLKEILHENTFLFRPPFGKMTYKQFVQLKKTHSLVLWSMLTQDYEASFSIERSLKEMSKGIQPGAIFVFHDSEQAWPKLQIMLPALIEEAQVKGYDFAVLPVSTYL
jgi:peptidoglycan/xylan/chitin deacetylase (PgdA/CDA1 family)